MYRNRKRNLRNKNTENVSNNSQHLNTIDENASIKIPRLNEKRSENAKEKDAAHIIDNIIGNSEENIPASQEPTPRYLSQRSNTAVTLGRTQSRLNSSQRQPNNYFELALMKAGVQLDEGDNFLLVCDHITFVSRLRDLFIEKNPNFQDHIAMFKSGLRDAWPKLAFKLLAGCTISLPNDNITYYSQNSMISNFFMIDFLRDIVLNLLLEKIEENACQRKSVMTKHSSGVPILPLMLSQLQYVSATDSDLIFDYMKRILEKPNHQSKWDIIASAEFILNAKKHDDFAQLLLDNFSNSKELFQNVGIQTLMNLILSPRMQSNLRSKILAFIKSDQCSVTVFPLLVKLLLKIVSSDNEDNMKNLVNVLREILNWPENGSSLSNLCKDKKLQLELFAYIEERLVLTKKFYSIWQKTIANMNTKQFKPIDFIMILLLIHVREDNSLHIENMLRRHLRNLSVPIIQAVRNKYSPMLEHHWHILIEIINNFLLDKHKNISEFGQEACNCFFGISESVQKLILKNLLHLTCERSSLKITNFALNMLRHLWQLYPKILHKWGMLLLPFLDHIHEMSLSQIRIVLELLSSIAYPVPTLDDCPQLQNQIDMLIKKQIINRNLYVKKQGIIGSVQLIDCIARIEETMIQHDEFETTFSFISELPDGRSKIAGNYIERVQSSTVNSPECLALFFDELATVCNSGRDERANNMCYDKPFLIWLCEIMTIYLQNHFIVEYNNVQIDGVNLISLKCINSPLDTNTDDVQSELPTIAINIGGLVLKPTTEAISSILVLCPLFNLVRVLQMQRYERSLEIINALLGCSIILPDFFEEPNSDAIFYNYDVPMQKKILDIYFHCANWMRETIAAFATQRSDMLRKKVLQRLGELIKIEGQVREMLIRAPSDYSPPQCQFLEDNLTINRSGIKNKKTVDSKDGNNDGERSITKVKKNRPNTETQVNNLNETNVTDISIRRDVPNKDSNRSGMKSNFENLYGPKEIYRQMDIDIVLILKENLTLEYPLPKDVIGTKMGLLEFRFILSDVVIKVESVVGIQKFHSEQALQYIARPEYLLCDLSNFIKTIDEKMNTMSTAIKNKLEEIDYVHSRAELFTEEFNLIKVCFGLCLRLLVAYFSWSHWFKNEQHISKLKESLLVLMDRKSADRLRDEPIPILAAESFVYILSYEKIIVDLKSAVYLYQLIDVLHVLSEKTAKDNQIQEMRTLCRILLCRKWFNYDGLMERGAQCNTHLDYLVKNFVRDSDFQRQREILRIVRTESNQLLGKQSSLKSFPNISTANFPLLFRALCEVFIKSLNEELCSDGIVAVTHNELELWEVSCKLLNMLLEIMQNLSIPRNFQIFLKHSHIYLKLALQHGLNVFEKHLRHNPDRVCDLIKNTQTITRFLHHLCCHSKALKNTAIVSQIPTLRETLENYVFRIKALLTANKCSSVFCMGNLKNKDLHGDDILSQTGTLGTISTNNPENSDEEIPDDDISIDETITTNDDNNMHNSCQNSRSKSSASSKCF